MHPLIFAPPQAADEAAAAVGAAFRKSNLQVVVEAVTICRQAANK